jgi:hypothetical protein
MTVTSIPLALNGLRQNLDNLISNRDNFVTHDNSFSLIIAANQANTRKLLFPIMTNYNYLNAMTRNQLLHGLPRRRLHMIIHGFVFEEDTKPVHEHHLQPLLPCLQACFPVNMTMTES